jgi:hypothetical protein
MQAQKQRPVIGHVRRGNMTNEEREALLNQQRQSQYDLEFLANEDPSLYKAVMDKQAAEPRPRFSGPPSMSEFGSLIGLDDTYQSGNYRRDVVDYFYPEQSYQRDNAQKIMGGGSRNLGIGPADLTLVGGPLDALGGWNYLKEMSQRNREAKATVRQTLVDEGYNPASTEFWKELQKRLPKKEGSGEALFDVAFGALELGVAAKLSFEVLGNFFKNVIPKNPFLTLEEYLAESLRQRELGASQRLPISTEQNWGELMEPVDETPITDPEVLLTARETDNLDETLANADFTSEDDQLLNDLGINDVDAYTADYNRRLNERIDTALATRPEYQTPSVIRDIEQLRAAGEEPSMIEEYLAGVTKEYERDFGQIDLISQARNTGQLRELYEKNGLPIPKTYAEERAADLIIQSRYTGRVATGEPIDQDMRRGIDLDYLEAHATPDVFNKAKPTIQETLELERQRGFPNNINNDIGALNNTPVSPRLYSPSVRAAEGLPQEKGSYTQLKAWMLKNGAKAKEMEWTGADEAFEGRTNVTKKELVDYLTDNQNLLFTDRTTAKGVMRGDTSGRETREAIETYVDDNLYNEIRHLEDSFDRGWEYSTEFESIADFVAGGNDEVLDEIARSMRVQNIRNGQDLAESYPDGWVNYNRSTKEYEVFADRDEAVQADMPEFTEEARQSLREYVDNLEYNDADEFNRILFGDELTADPSELVYAKYFPQGGTNMSETTYQFVDPTGQLPDDYFINPEHFEKTGADKNLVAHARTAEFPVQGGGTAYHVGEGQADIAQALREKNKATGEVRKFTPRTREEEIQIPQEQALFDDIRAKTVTAEDILNRAVFGDDVGMSTAWRREQPEYAEQLETFKKVMADFKTKQSQAASGNGEFVIWQPDQIDVSTTFFEQSKGEMFTMRKNLDAFSKYIIDLASDVPPELLDTPGFSQYKPYINWAERYKKDLGPEIADLQVEHAKIKKPDYENTKTGAPFIESTDAWVGMLLKRQLKEAIESGANFMTLPNPKMVKKYTYGDYEGHRTFYGDIAAGKLLDIAKSYDPDATLVGKLIETSAGPEPVSALPLTQKLIDAIMEKGISTYAVPLAVGAGSGYGALNQVGGQDGRSGS